MFNQPMLHALPAHSFPSRMAEVQCPLARLERLLEDCKTRLICGF